MVNKLKWEIDRWLLVDTMKRRAQDAIEGRAFLQTLHFTPKQLQAYDQRIAGIARRLAKKVPHD